MLHQLDPKVKFAIGGIVAIISLTALAIGLEIVGHLVAHISTLLTWFTDRLKDLTNFIAEHWLQAICLPIAIGLPAAYIIAIRAQRWPWTPTEAQRQEQFLAKYEHLYKLGIIPANLTRQQQQWVEKHAHLVKSRD